MKEDYRKVETFLRENGYEPKETRKLLGDASSRRYYISKCANVSLCISYDVNEFIQNKDFLKTSMLFKDYVRTPAILSNNNYELIIQEDLGSISLNSHISRFPRERDKYVERAILDIVKYQSIELGKFRSISHYEFDDAKISFEFDLAVEFFLVKYLGAQIEDNILKDAKNLIMKFFRENKAVVCHRDYHSRNLMIKNSELVHIDYQDARVGPQTYDLVSLLEDCYFRYSEAEKKTYKKYFLENNQSIDRTTFESDYNITAVQRIFKALGSFAYLKLEKNKAQYEKNIGHAFENLRSVLEVVPELEDFRIEICRAYYEN